MKTASRNPVRAGIAGIVAGALLAACVGIPDPIAPRAIPSTEVAIDPQGSPMPVEVSYQCQVGDVLDIKFFYNPELNETVIVRPDGRIAMQLIGEVSVLGLTPTDLGTILTERYGKILRRPESTVLVRSFSAQKIFVGGEVPAPGATAISGKSLTALEAILERGGFKHSAERSNVVVLRNTGGPQPMFYRVDLARHLAQDGVHDIALKPNDIVYVPQTKIAGVAQFFDEYILKIIPIYRNMNLNFGVTKQYNDNVNR